MKWFRTNNIDWKRFGWILTGVGLTWAALVLIIPATLFKYVSSILAAAGVALGYFTRSGKWVEDRVETPKP